MVFTIYERGGHLGHVAQMPQKKSVPPTQGGSTLNLALIGQAVSEKKMSEHCGRRTTEAGPWVYYKLICELSAQVS